MTQYQPPSTGPVEEATNDLVQSYLAVREAIGILGFFLPAALLLWTALLGGGEVRPSISAYAYTPMGAILTGTLCAIAVFLWNYEGYRRRADEVLTDRATARAASLGALMVALAPIAPPPGVPFGPALAQQVLGPQGSAIVHYAGAALFFAALAVFCLVLFTRSDGVPDAEKRAANMIYRGAGIMIVASVGLIALLLWGDWPEGLVALNPVFWLEVVAVLAFALSWLIKGKALRPVVRAMAR